MTPIEVWMQKETCDLFCALPLYYEQEVTINEERGKDFSLPFKYTVYVLFGYALDVGDDNDISHGLCVKPKALERVAVYLGPL
jgi:hypothetical protein